MVLTVLIAASPLLPQSAKALTTAANVIDLEPSKVPWCDGEKLTYRVHLGIMEAVEGSFSAKDLGHAWEFKLHFRSVGMVEGMYPMRDWFWSICTKKPWRSVEYGEERFEGDKHMYERTDIDYTAQLATRNRWFEGKTQTFKTPAAAIDDTGSMLYSLRYGPWKVGQKRQFLVYESRHLRSAEANCVAIERLPILEEEGSPEIDCYKIVTEPLDLNLRKKGFKLTLWITKDGRRLPVRSEMTFRYGTVTSRLINVVR